MIIVVNLDPHGAHEDTVELPLGEFGLPADAAFSLEEAFTGSAVCLPRRASALSPRPRNAILRRSSVFRRL